MTKPSSISTSGTSTEEQAFRAFYNEFYPRVMAYLKKVLKTDAYAEDIAQDTFVRFWKSRIKPGDDSVDLARGRSIISASNQLDFGGDMYMFYNEAVIL